MSRWLLVAGVAGAALLLTYVLRRYALARSLMDIPNARSSHSVPTPRGGGAAIVVSFLVALALIATTGGIEWSASVALLGAGGFVALVGFLDDHGHIAARWRLLAHFGAAFWALGWLGGAPALQLFGVQLDLGWLGVALAAVYLVWLLNLYNFMDGIDGLAAGEAVLVASTGAFLTKGSPVSFALFALAASVLGFLIWNWSPAKIFMGDAGSGFLGFAFFSFALYTENTNTLPLLTWAVLVSVFAVDATLTLVMRARQRKRLSEAHRDHLYQQFIKSGYRHASVTIGALLLGFCASLPAFFFSRYISLLFAVIYVLLGVLWVQLYRRFSSISPEEAGKAS